MSHATNYWGYYLGILSCCKVSTTHLNIGYPKMEPSNELQWPELKIGRRVSNPSEVCRVDMLYSVWMYCPPKNMNHIFPHVIHRYIEGWTWGEGTFDIAQTILCFPSDRDHFFYITWSNRHITSIIITIKSEVWLPSHCLGLHALLCIIKLSRSRVLAHWLRNYHEVQDSFY